MATINDGINGGFSGKAGSVVGYMSRGKSYMRGLPKLSAKNKKGSITQNANRSAFTNMQKFLRPILAYVRQGFLIEGQLKHMSAHNAAKSYNMLHAITADKQIDYSKVCISYGSLLGAENPTVEMDDTGLHFTWTINTETDLRLQHDQVVLLVYDVKTGLAHGELNGARRAIGKESVELNSYSKGKTLHCWMAFVSNDRQRTSMSSYLGSVVF